MNPGQTPPSELEPARREDGARGYDPQQRLIAARLQRANPHWLLFWGTHSRRYFAFPLFAAPRGIFVTSSDPSRLLTRMRQTEALTATRPPPGPPLAPLPGTERGRLCG